MTASELLSLSERVWSHVSFQAFALNCCIPEALSKEILGAVTSAVAAVTDHRYDELLVFLIIGENVFEVVT